MHCIRRLLDLSLASSDDAYPRTSPARLRWHNEGPHPRPLSSGRPTGCSSRGSTSSQAAERSRHGRQDPRPWGGPARGGREGWVFISERGQGRGREKRERERVGGGGGGRSVPVRPRGPRFKPKRWATAATYRAVVVGSSDPLPLRHHTCIMHSRRVGFWNTDLAASAYFGFTNSTTKPGGGGGGAGVRKHTNTQTNNRSLQFIRHDIHGRTRGQMDGLGGGGNTRALT